ncbi:PadR family transcriptional regulator [Deinococcus marmoris]|uniref:Transcriptional regulator, PadR family n=1 Tax=Deinococcus marmoris TaxID=249408 RepID=A0A1U7P3G6_9DEIO|nr:PadR family transcriptional regulator [Deinococcus marmoris]OLV19704.1 Transcriptional regulator, PadR family [Deinococcus marmoris]
MPVRAKAATTTLGYALLGLLAREERSGYELTHALKNPVGYFWFAQHSQVYPELARLETAGLVAYTLVEQSDRPDKKVYRLTDAGRAALRAWLNDATEPPRKRDELVLKAYSIWLADPTAAAQMMREHAQTHLAHLAEFQSGLSRLEQEAGETLWQPESPWFGVHAVLRRGIGYEREYSDWCEWLAQCLEGTQEAAR